MATPAIRLSVEGDGLAALQRKLKAMEGGKVLARELNKSLREIGKELIPDARAAARSNLPRGGGLGAYVADGPMRVTISASKREPGVKIVAKAGGGANRGSVRHPVFGNKKVWAATPVDPGWFTEAMEAEAPKARPKLVAAMERTAEKIARS